MCHPALCSGPTFTSSVITWGGLKEHRSSVLIPWGFKALGNFLLQHQTYDGKQLFSSLHIFTKSIKFSPELASLALQPKRFQDHK